uniref:Uncharacterized protein n=1 Tax=Meloidogyne enterolobii TaxID=390850 RepID=A0A6V7X5Q6_MELEN|nr:unnamed protein product [Meloidogyne enterolobii]
MEKGIGSRARGKRLEENKKRIYGNFRKRRAVESIKEQYDKHGYFDLDADELNKFIKLLSEEDEAISPKLTNLSLEEGGKNIRLLPPANQKSLYLKVIDKFIQQTNIQLEPTEQLVKHGYFDMQKQTSFSFMKFLGKEQIRLPPISPAPLAVDGIERVRFRPYTDQMERIKQAIKDFMNPQTVVQTEEKVASVNSQELALESESTPQIVAEHENPQVNFSQEFITQQLEKEGYFDMPKDRAYKFIKYLNTEIKGAKLPNVSTVAESSDELVRLEPQTDQKDLIMNAIKSFMSSEPIQQHEKIDTEEESIVENDQENSEETEVPSPTILKTPITPETPVTSPIIETPPTPVTSPIIEAPPTPVTSPIIEAPPTPMTSPIIEAPPTPEPHVTSPLNEENQIESIIKDKTPLDGKITPLTYVEEPDEKPLLTDDQKVLMGMAVRAATRAWRNSVELAAQAQINMELGEKYWQNARLKYALKDSVITLKETGETVHLRKTPENILEWKPAAMLQKHEKAADRAKAAERKVKDAASQVEEAVAGQKRLSEEIIGKVDAELSKQDTAIEDTLSTIEDENETLPEENIGENIEENDNNEALTYEDEEEWTPPLPEEENIEANEEPTIIEEDTEEDDTREETPQESQTISDENEEQWTPPLPEEKNIEEPTIIEEATEEDTQENTPQESQTLTDEDEEQWTPPLPEEENIEVNVETQIIEEAAEEEDTQENTPQESQTLPDEDEEKWTPPLPEENIEEHTIIEEGTEEEYTQEETLQESQAIEDKDEEWSPPLA